MDFLPDPQDRLEAEAMMRGGRRERLSARSVVVAIVVALIAIAVLVIAGA